jgi:hypothetical protein
LEWHVAADDRWHDTRTDTGIRHQRVDGVAVFETKVRVPGGDAVQHVWSVADRGGLTIVEVANESPLPIAVAFTGPELLTGRPPTDVPIQGIDLPPGSIGLRFRVRRRREMLIDRARQVLGALEHFELSQIRIRQIPSQSRELALLEARHHAVEVHQLTRSRRRRIKTPDRDRTVRIAPREFPLPHQTPRRLQPHHSFHDGNIVLRNLPSRAGDRGS